MSAREDSVPPEDDTPDDSREPQGSAADQDGVFEELDDQSLGLGDSPFDGEVLEAQEREMARASFEARFESSSMAIPPPTWAKEYEDIAKGTFENVFVPAYLQDRALVAEETMYRRRRDERLLDEHIEEGRRAEAFVSRGQTFGMIIFSSLMIIMLVIVLFAIWKGASAVAIAALTIFGGGTVIAVVGLMQSNRYDGKSSSPRSRRSEREQVDPPSALPEDSEA